MKNVSRHYVPIVFPNRNALIKTLKNKAVLNTSNHNLSDVEIETLCLGLNFIPAHQPADETRGTDQWLTDLNNTIYFSLIENDISTNRGWLQSIAPTTWLPPPQEWESDQDCLKEVIKLRKLLIAKPTNTHREIANAAKKLGENSNFHILKADKGRNVVLWSTDDYNREADRNFSDPSVYKELNQLEYRNQVSRLKQKVDNTANFLLDSGLITKRESDYITNGEPSGSIIYFLPKTHKPINETSNTFAGRPIVATYTSSTHGIDQYLTQVTKPILELIPGSLRDTTNLIRKLPTNILPRNAEIYTADVDSLYPSIPWEGGLNASTCLYAKFLPRLKNQAYEKKLLQPPPVHIFRELLELVIENAYINFKNHRFFHQRSGTAMGTCISVYFANAYMYQVTAHIIERPPPGTITFERYIDDILVIVDNKQQDPTWVDRFFKSITNESIKYTINKESTYEQCYLDVKIRIDKTTHTLKTEPYKKPTASGNYLHPSSAHPKHIIRAIPYSQFLRIRRISSTIEIYDHYSKHLTRDLRKSGFKSRALNKARLKARSIDREALINPLNKEPTKNKSHFSNAFKFITPYKIQVNWRNIRKQIKKAQNKITQYYLNQNKTNVVQNLNLRPTELIFENTRNIGSYFTKNFKHPNPYMDH